MQIELIPALKNPNIKSKLENLFLTCKNFMGCTAFWSIGIDFFQNKALAFALKKPNSFLCADIQFPTNLDKILEYSKYGVTEIYLHKYRQAPNKNNKNKNTNLLHSKILVFVLNDTDAEIWVGSHNLTGYAILGVNLEASITIKCKITDTIYQDVYNYLQYVKNEYCFKFDPKMIDIYKKLQEDAKKTTEIIDTAIKNIITLVGYNMDKLAKEKIIQLLSIYEESDKFGKYKIIGSTVYLHTYDIGLKKEYLYECTIAQSGKFGKDKLELEFIEPRRFAYIGTSKLPFLRPEAKISEEMLLFVQYFVTLSITKSNIDNFEIYQKPTEEDLSFWKTATNNPYKYKLTNDTILFGEQDDLNYKIQEATFDKSVTKIKIDLTKYWEKYGNKLEKFYSELNILIENELLFIQDYRKDLFKDERIEIPDGLTYLDYDKTSQFIDFLKKMKKDNDLPSYVKSQIERMIIFLKTKE